MIGGAINAGSTRRTPRISSRRRPTDWRAPPAGNSPYRGRTGGGRGPALGAWTGASRPRAAGAQRCRKLMNSERVRASASKEPRMALDTVVLFCF